MPRPKKRVPSYRLHKASGRAVVTLNGRDIYLGDYNSPQSHVAYDRAILDWLGNHRTLEAHPHDDGECPGLTVGELVLDFWDHAKAYYRKDGEPTREVQAIHYSLRPLAELYADLPANSFGPRKLKAVRQKMIDDGLARTLINKRINRIRHAFKWAVENEMVEPAILDGLRAVSPLKRGRCDARESPPVKPAPQHLIDGVEPYLSRQVWAMVQLQLCTAMRPGEVVTMRPADIDRSGSAWVYSPGRHKTEHHGHERRVYLGPQAQRLVMPFLGRDEDDYLFSPVDAEAERRSAQHSNRRTPLSCGNRPGTNRKRKPKRQPRPLYDKDSYRRAISRACDRAYPWPNLGDRKANELSESEKEAQKQWQREHGWHPHQLRHNAATFIRKQFGVEAARLILGHKSVAITELYAELDHEKAVQIITEVG